MRPKAVQREFISVANESPIHSFMRYIHIIKSTVALLCTSKQSHHQTTLTPCQLRIMPTLASMIQRSVLQTHCPILRLGCWSIGIPIEAHIGSHPVESASHMIGHDSHAHCSQCTFVSQLCSLFVYVFLRTPLCKPPFPTLIKTPPSHKPRGTSPYMIAAHLCFSAITPLPLTAPLLA